MFYYSTKNSNYKVSLEKAVLKGMPDDGGLFMPEKLPIIPDEEFEKLKDLNYKDLSFYLAKLFIDDIPENELRKIIDDAYYFEPPLIYLSDKIGVLELFHGPTLAFKDFGARFMSRLMSFFVKKNNTKLHILIATSGDTGSAIGNAFQNVENINVTILYPSGKISEIQEKQIASLEGNIESLEIDGTFDDCQNLVKRAFIDKELNSVIKLSSANSINISRLIPQIFYYFYGYFQAKFRGEKIVFSVPSGNFGNLTAGLIAFKMGLSVELFIAATNINHVVPDYLKTGVFIPMKSISTISNAMDVGNPNNFDRMLNLFSYDEMKSIVKGFWLNDELTKQAIIDTFNKYKYVIDPHGAIGIKACEDSISNFDNNVFFVSLETAHYSKFMDIVSPLLNKNLTMPDRLKKYLNLPKKSIKLSKDYDELKNHLLKKYS